MMDLWILDGDGRPVRTDSMLEWGSWRARATEDGPYRVDETFVGELRVSTVFLGIDHNWSAAGPPLLYETMIFGATDEYCERYATRAEAEAGHALAVTIATLYVAERAAERER